MNRYLVMWIFGIGTIIGGMIGYLKGHIDERNYWRQWTEGFGVGEYYLNGNHEVRFGLKKGCP